MYKKDSVINNQQRLICHKTRPNKTNVIISGDMNAQIGKNENN